MMKFEFSKITSRTIILITLFYSLSAIFFALYYQYIKNFPPCELCIYQRIPYFLSILICVVYLKNFLTTKLSLLLLSISFIVSFLISGFHVGVEKKYWNFRSGCSSNTDSFENIDQLRAFLEKVEIIKCDEVILSFYGISMAQGNMLISLFLSIILTFLTFKNYYK